MGRATWRKTYVDLWDTGQHYVITHPTSGRWVQQSGVPDAPALVALNSHEVRCGRTPAYLEQKFSTEEIQQRNTNILNQYKE